MRIRLVQMELSRSVIDGPDAYRGFPIPDVAGWTPFQIEREDVSPGPWYGSGERPDPTPRVRLDIWLREDDS